MAEKILNKAHPRRKFLKYPPPPQDSYHHCESYLQDGWETHNRELRKKMDFSVNSEMFPLPTLHN